MQKTFYKIVDNKAQVGSGTFVPEDFIEYEIGNEPEELILALEVDYEIERIQAIKSKAGELIKIRYPIEKQSSAQLGIYGDVYLAEMKEYIADIIRISNEAEANGTTLEDINWELNNGN